MAEAMATISLVSNITQFIIFGSMVVKRVNEFKNSVNDVPKVFRDIKIELPLLLDTLERTKEQAELGIISDETQSALLPVVDGCNVQVRLLEEMLSKVLASSEDSSWQRSRKALTSFAIEKKSQTVIETLRGYVQILTYYQATSITRSERPSDSQKFSEPVFTVPFERDPGFIDRPEIMSKLEKRLEERRCAALAGVGGVGKTQLAIEYCYRYRERDPKAHILWVRASTASRVDQAYKQIARKLNVPGWDDLSLNTFETVSEWLNEHGRWLLIFDNADNIDLFFGTSAVVGQEKQMYEYLPRCEDGITIITTRDKRVGYRLTDREDLIVVPPMSVSDAGNLLRSKIMQDQGPPHTLTRAAELLESLGNLPLAITQAAAFITENSMTIADYLEVLRESQSEVEALLSEEMGDHRRSSDSESSIMNTLKLSFDQIAKQKPLAANILSFMAYLDRHGIPRSLIKGDNVRTVDFVSALGMLQAFSLIDAERGGETFEMHRLVQISVKRWLGTNRGKWQDDVLKTVSERFPLGDFNNWKECEMLSPHAHAAISHADSTSVNILRRAKILHNLARFDQEQSRYELAEKRYTEVIDIRERYLGIDNCDTLKSKSYLGEVLFLEGKYAKAAPIVRQVITESTKLFGQRSEETLFNIGLLAEILQGDGKWPEAEVLFRTVLQGKEDTLLNTVLLTVADNLGAVLRDEGKFEEAELWIRKSLTGRERLLGPTHIDTLRSADHLALILSLMDRLDEAELEARRALAAFEMAVGPDHHRTSSCLHTLGKILRLQGHYEQAAEKCRRALDGFAKVLGPGDRGTLRCLQSLALIEECQGKFAEAEALLVQVVEGNTKALGQAHQHTLDSVRHLERVVMAKEMQASSVSSC